MVFELMIQVMIQVLLVKVHLSETYSVTLEKFFFDCNQIFF